ncbi:hypothetical protein QUB56_32865 [Microcoleus sp. AR_TQ3_B6]|uniref:hypothetical protein n=1 Tax=Microcoleus sp. AR_TQ3_B6 TaxID=3055284 RepID=UPI002FD5AC22
MRNRKSGNFTQGVQTFERGRMLDSKTAPPYAIGLDGTRTKTGAAEPNYDFSCRGNSKCLPISGEATTGIEPKNFIPNSARPIYDILTI